jgi:DNA-binding SARP family transcriptional activator/ATP/maltotriose-dependent transcriptional regulator MalT
MWLDWLIIMLKLFLFGTPHITYHDQPIKLARRKALALLCYVAIHPQPLGRDSLATLLWSELDQERSRGELRVSLWGINKAIGDDWFITTRDTVQMNPDKPVWTDVGAFESFINTPKTHTHHPNEVCLMCLPPYEKAVALYTNDFLAGFGVSAAPDFDDWMMTQAEALRVPYHTALKKLVLGYSAQNQYETALGYAQRWLALDPFHEEAHRLIMCLQAWMGNKTGALGAYLACERILADELDVQPSADTTQLYEAIRADNFPNLPMIYYDLPDSSPDTPHNLPPQPNPFRGRATEIGQLTAQLADAHCRLVTIVGLGGTGKTRLAVHVARQIVMQSKDGVYVVSLLGIMDKDALITVIAQTIGFQFSSSADALGQLQAYLAPKTMLIVLDNFEHLIAHADILDALLQHAPRLQLLVTSRVALNRKAEWVFTLNHMTDGAEQLFIDTARRIDRYFAPTDDDQRTIDAICDQLAGMPLAIELAATWVRVLTVAQILGEIQQNLAGLGTDWADIPDRHRSLSATFDYSWGLLSPTDQQALAKLAIFPAHFGYDSAKAITSVSVMTLSRLVGHGLVHHTAQGRYELHPLIRQFAHEKLMVHQTVYADIVRVFIGHIAQFLAGQYPILRSEAMLEARYAIYDEIDSIRAACQLALDHHHADMLRDSLHSMALFYDYQVWYAEAIALFERFAYALPDSHLLSVRAKVYLARFYQRIGNYTEAERLLNVVDPHLKDYPYEMALAYLQWASVKFSQNIDEAMQYAHKAYDIYDELNDTLWRGVTLRSLAELYGNKGRVDEAINFAEQGLAVLRPFGDIVDIAPVYRVLGRLYQFEGKFELASDHCQKAITIYQKYDIKDQIIRTQVTTANIENRLGQYDHAKAILEEALASAEALQVRESSLFVLFEYATNAYYRKQFADAVQILERALELARQLSMPIYADYIKLSFATTLIEIGQFTRAEGMAQEALTHFSGRSDFNGMVYGHLALGKVYLGMMRYAEAITQFNQALVISQNQKMVTETLSGQLYLGMAHYHLGDYATAVPLIVMVRQNEKTVSEDIERANAYYDKIITTLGEEQVKKMLNG